MSSSVKRKIKKSQTDSNLVCITVSHPPLLHFLCQPLLVLRRVSFYIML